MADSRRCPCFVCASGWCHAMLPTVYLSVSDTRSSRTGMSSHSFCAVFCVPKPHHFSPLVALCPNVHENPLRVFDDEAHLHRTSATLKENEDTFFGPSTESQSLKPRSESILAYNTATRHLRPHHVNLHPPSVPNHPSPALSHLWALRTLATRLPPGCITNARSPRTRPRVQDISRPQDTASSFQREEEDPREVRKYRDPLPSRVAISPTP